MKKAKVWKWIAATGTSLLFLFTFIFSMGVGVFSTTKDGGLNAGEHITAEAAASNVTRPNGTADYAQFVNDYQYLFTDKTKFASVHAGTATDDMTTVIVDTTVAWGTSAANPYVIETTDDWELFVKKMGADSTKGSGKFFALARDLDFASTTFHMCAFFQGTFYGLGHTIKNATCSNWQYWNGSAYVAVVEAATNGGFGLFGKLQNAAITDLINENYSFTNVPMLRSLSHWTGSGLGAIAGVCYGTTHILNCQTSGTSAQATNTSKSWSWSGGIVGCLTGVTYLYRCSADVAISIPTDAASLSGAGGMVGEVMDKQSCYTYDCAARVKVTTSTTSASYSHIGAVIGWGNGYIYIENFVGTLETSPDSIPPYSGALGGSGVSTLKKNIYVDGKQGTLNLVPWTTTGTTSNFNCVLSGSYHGRYNNVGYINANTTHATRAALFTAAKTAVGNNVLPKAIWDASKIDAEDYTPVNSPVRNIIKTSVTYWNYKEGGSADQYSVDDSTAPIEVKAGDNLCTTVEIPALIRDNRKFEGWTTDVTGKSEPFKVVPYSLLGDCKLYAVWSPVKYEFGITASGEGSDFTTDATAHKSSMTYNGDGDSSGVKLETSLNVPNMYNTKATYQWNKDETPITSGGTASSYTVINVRDSGDYTVTVSFHDALEPLFMGKFTSNPAESVKIIPAKLRCDSVTFENGLPYSGAPYTTAVPTAIVKDVEEGTRVKGETKWFIDLSTFNNDTNTNATIDKEKNTETTKIIFTPAEEYNGNYGETVEFTVTFNIEYLKFIFDIPRISNLKLEVKLEYGQHYTYNNVVTMFEEVFEPYLGNLAGNTPAFIVDEQIVKINDYRKWPVGGGSTTAYGNVTKSYTIEVTFVPQSYKVTFDPRNENQTPPPEAMDIGHGIRIPKPNDPKYGSQMFLGWFYDYEDPDTHEMKTNIAWNFDVDRVTHELKLYAKWLQADKLIGLTVTPSPLIKYIAKEAVDPAYLTVKAIFEGTDEDTGTTVTQEVVLSKDQYSISYEGGKTALHAKADPEATSKITFKHTYNGTTATAELDVIVQKILVDTSVLKQFFKDTAVVVNGSAQSIKEIDPMRISQLLPSIAGCKVEYKYFNSNEDEIDPSEVVNVGSYFARAYFTPTDVDYDAPYIEAIFQIVTERIKISIDWGETEFVFNGKEQRPMPTFKDGDEEVNANYTYTITKVTNPSEVLQPIKARTDYLITIELEDLAYELDGVEYKAFSIVPAVLKVPTQIKQFPYIGQEYDLNALSESECEVFFSDFDLSMMRVNAGDNIKGDKGTNAGRYNASIILLDPDSSKFEDGTSKTTMPWQIAKAQLTVEWDSYEFYENMPKTVPAVLSLYEFYGDDGEHFKMSDLDYMGDILATTSGEYTIVISIKPEAEWASNYELDKTKTCNFVILPRAGMEIITLEWDSNTLFTFNGQVQHPTFKVKNKVGGYVEDINMNLFRYNDESQNSRWAGDYEMIVSLPATSNYYLTGKTNCYYTILVNSEGMGNKPGEGPTQDPELKPGGDDVGGNPGNNTMNLPLWQLIVTGVSAVLFVVCAAKAFSEYGKLKDAKRKAKELASVSYAVSYGLAPLPLLALGVGETFLGMGNTAWTVIAFVALGVFLISLVVLLMITKKRKAADLVVEREQARINEEKEFQRQEEMKMMFATMQQGFQQQPALNYGDMQGMIAASVQASMQAMLPAVSQMAALPPAQSDASAYADPYAQQQPQYSALPPASGGAPSSEADMLRAQMAEQQARMEAQMAQQQAQMAQQQAMINQLLQNQQAPAYEEDAHDEALWQDDGDVISLEESYGKLSEEAKRCYYDLGSYIMNKPKIAQNDGKYAVLFKYRGKTMFKLCIRGDAPVLYYAVESGARESIRISDAATLAAAKAVIDANIAKRDAEMG